MSASAPPPGVDHLQPGVGRLRQGPQEPLAALPAATGVPVDGIADRLDAPAQLLQALDQCGVPGRERLLLRRVDGIEPLLQELAHALEGGVGQPRALDRADPRGIVRARRQSADVAGLLETGLGVRREQVGERLHPGDAVETAGLLGDAPGLGQIRGGEDHHLGLVVALGHHAPLVMGRR